MDLLTKNWEKILLGVVLVGLLLAVAFLPLKISSEKGQLAANRETVLVTTVDPIAPPDLSRPDRTLQRTKTPVALDLTSEHRLLNPVLWQKSAGGRIIKVQTGGEIGPRAVVVNQITPLHLVLTLDSVLTTESGSRYAIGIERQAAERVSQRRKRQTYAAAGDQNETFRLLSVQGPAEEPTAVQLELRDTGDRVSVGKDKPYRRVDGYMADLEYPPENRRWANKRVGDKIGLGGAAYNIVAITSEEVVLSAPSGKKTSLKYSPDAR